MMTPVIVMNLLIIFYDYLEDFFNCFNCLTNNQRAKDY